MTVQPPYSNAVYLKAIMQPPTVLALQPNGLTASMTQSATPVVCGYDYRGECCPSACEAGWGDGICVAACSIAACGYDGGDCCPTACVPLHVETGSAMQCAMWRHADLMVETVTWMLALHGVAFELAEHVGFDGLAKGGVGAIVSGASVTMKSCAFKGTTRMSAGRLCAGLSRRPCE